MKPIRNTPFKYVSTACNVQNFADQGIYLPKNAVYGKQFGLHNILMFVDYEQRVPVYGGKPPF